MKLRNKTEITLEEALEEFIRFKKAINLSAQTIEYYEDTFLYFR